MTKTKTDGGPEFPRPASEDSSNGTLSDGNEVREAQCGMSIRAYFAGQALPVCAWGYSPIPAAKLAVEYADALIAKLNEPKETQ